MNLTLERREIIIFGSLLLLSFIVRLLLFSVSGYKNDIGTFTAWFNAAAEHGPRVFYNVIWSDYPPFNVYLFWAFGSIGRYFALSGTNLVYLIKLLPNLFDMATTFLIFAFVRKQFDFNTSLLTVALYAFNPAVIFDAAIWGQYDPVYTFFLVLSLMLFFSSKPKLSAVAFAIGVLTKPQSIAFAPLIVFLIFRKYGWRRLVTSILAAAVTVIIVILPFEWNNPVSFLVDIYFGAYGGYAYTSVNAFNLWAIGGMWVKETPVFFALGWIMFGASAAYILFVVNKRFEKSGKILILYAAFMLFFSFFMLPTRIHERYLFPALSMLALMLPFSRKIRPIYAILTFTCFANQAYVLHFLNNDQFIQFGDPVVLTVTLINLIAFLYSLLFLPKALNKKEIQQIPGQSTEKTGRLSKNEH